MTSGIESRKKRDDEAVPFRKLFAFADAIDVALIVTGAVGAAVAGAPLPIMTYLFGQTLNALGAGYSTNPHQQLRAMSQASMRAATVGGIAAIGYFFQISCWMTTGQRQADRIRSLYLEALLRQDASFFDQEISTGAVVQSMTVDSFHIQQAIGEKVGKVIQICATLVSGLAVAFSEGWKLTIVILALVPLILATGYVMDLTISRTSRKMFLAKGYAGSIIEQIISSIRTVMTFTGERKALEAYDKALKKADRASWQAALASGLGMGAVMFFTYNTYALALWFGSHLIAHEGYSGGSVMAVLFSVIIGTGALSQSSTCLSAFALGTGAAQNIFPVIYRVPDVDVKDVTGMELEHLRGSISFENVKFAYPSRLAFEVFSDFSLTIPSGVPVAVVGKSGSGKSTIVSLLERFYDPQGGAVLIDGVNLKKLKLSWFRQQVGLVAQEPVLFETSVRENILYGKENATSEEVEAAAQLANASKFISGLPKGYDTMVGHDGLQLSGGQKQRIAIARAVLKDPRILLLDEATSSLDAESESVVHQALEKIMLNRTTIIISHRLTTVKNAHFIAVLDHGQIVEKGSHSELLSNPDGIFSQLVHLEERRKNEERENEVDKATLEELEIEVDTATLETAQQEDQRLEVTTGPRNHRKKMTSISSSRSLSFSSFGSISSIASMFQNETEKKLQAWRRMDDASTHNDESNESITCSHILRLAAYNRPDIPILLLGSLAAIANGAIMPVVGLLLANMMHTFYGPLEQISSSSMTWIRLFVAIACLSLVLIPLQSLCFTVAGEKLIRRIRLLTFDKILHQEVAWFDQSENASGVISSRLLRDAAHVRTMVGDALALIEQNLTTVIVGLFIAISTCWQLALLFVGMLPFYSLDAVMQIKLSETLDAKAKMMYEETSRLAYEAVSNIRTVASFCAERKVLKFYRSKNKISIQNGVRRAVIAGFVMAVTYIVMFGSLSFSFWVAGVLVFKRKVDGYGFVKTFFAIEMSAFAIALSVSLAPDVSSLKPAIASIFAMLDLQAKDLSIGTKVKRLKGEVEFRHAQFKYPTRPDVQIFHDLCFTLHAGKTLALVGESGGGKSTVLALMQRFYDLDGGQILLDRVDIKQLQIKWLRQQMGLVSQEPYLFNDTIRANIKYGIEGQVSEDELQQAAEVSNAHKFISSLPLGYESVVGDRGVQLSGGQKQRVAIARAMIRNPKIVLLDEATSALDAESEFAVQQALEKVALGRSTIVVAHRLSTVRNVDMIVYLKNGSVVEQGTHDELLRVENGLYATLVKISKTTHK